MTAELLYGFGFNMGHQLDVVQCLLTHVWCPCFPHGWRTPGQEWRCTEHSSAQSWSPRQPPLCTGSCSPYLGVECSAGKGRGHAGIWYRRGPTMSGMQNVSPIQEPITSNNADEARNDTAESFMLDFCLGYSLVQKKGQRECINKSREFQTYSEKQTREWRLRSQTSNHDHWSVPHINVHIWCKDVWRVFVSASIIMCC